MTTQTNGHAPTVANFTEAPASATIKAISPAGMEWLLTSRAATTRDLLAQVALLETWLTSNGWQPAATRPTAPGKAQASEPAEDAPLCSICSQPMKRRQTKDGSRSFWSCSTKYGNGQWCQGQPVK